MATAQLPGVQLQTVTTVSGYQIEVMGNAERRYYNAQKTKYTTENLFTQVADITDLDRLLFMELPADAPAPSTTASSSS